jgi:hypothetical protein
VTREAEPSAIVPAAVPGRRSLSAWSSYDWRGGVQIDDLSPLERLIVTTSNSTYEILLVTPERAEILVRGGAFFPVFTRARLAGSSLGGSFLKVRSVHVGFRLEFGSERGFIITSPVRTVTVAEAAADSNDIM